MKKKKVKKIFLFGLAASFLLSFTAFPQSKNATDLPPKYQLWLEEEVVYIITSLEKDVFLRLKTDRERDLFIEAFWKQRNPVPGAPVNEFKDEHYRRLQYANRMFGRTAPLPGWKTDRGRFYILLGEPNDIERFTGEAGIYNTEAWFYQGLAKYGLPTGFYLVFFQKSGVGDFVLYSPTSDGPQALLTSYLGDQADYRQAYRKLKEISPSLANISLSLIPGESDRFGRPSLASDVLLQNIQALPEKEVKNKYAEKFLMYKDIVEVEYTANYIDCDSIIRTFKDPSGISFVHYSIELKKFSVNEREGKYSTNLRINGQASDLNGKMIYQYEGALPVEFSEDQLKKIIYKPFDFYDMFPLIPGNYRFSVLLKNEASQEFTSVERNIVIPEDGSPPSLSGLLVGYKIEPSVSASLKPFRLGRGQVMCQPAKIFIAQDVLFLNFQILDSTPELEGKGTVRVEILRQEEKVLSLTRKVGDYANKLDILEEFPLAKLPPGAYWLVVTLQKDEQVLQTDKEPFEITSIASLPRPWVFSRTLFPLSHPGFSFALGKQYFNQGKLDRALVLLEKAHRAQPNSQEYALALAQVYLALKEYEKAKDALLPFQDSPQAQYEVLFSLGQAHQALGEFDHAVLVFNRAISHHGLNANLLNSLGESYYRLGDIKAALTAWTKSLEISPEQKELKAKVESLKK
jgi:GWxTD domain-containing protein